MKTKYYDANHKCPHCKKYIIMWSNEIIDVEEITKNPPEEYGLIGKIRYKKEKKEK